MLTLHYHPLSSYSWKVLIALYENGAAFEPRIVDLGNPQARAAFAQKWPTGKIPLLEVDEVVVPETSIQIEHLDLTHPGRTRLLPGSALEQLEVRLWDRVFDQYVMDPMQRFVGQLLLPPERRDAHTSDAMRQALIAAYALIESRLGDRPWAAGEPFTMADCAAAPALFYASVIEPFAPEHTGLSAYFERLVARPSVGRVIRDARPWFAYFPLHQAIPARFLSEDLSPRP